MHTVMVLNYFSRPYILEAHLLVINKAYLATPTTDGVGLVSPFSKGAGTLSHCCCTRV